MINEALFTLKTTEMKRSIGIVFLLAVFLTGCSPLFYTPNTQNVPLISHKGDNKLTVAGNGNQVEVQGAIGLTNAFAIQANGGLYIPRNEDNGNGGSGKFLEVGGGYFTPINENFIFEAYGLVGFGTMENHFPTTTGDNSASKGDISANVLRVGIQPNFGYKSKHFEVALSSRIVNLMYSNIDGDLIFNSTNQIDYLKDNKSNFLLEPAITVRGGLEKIKLQLQYGYSYNISNSDFQQDNSYLTVGLNYTF